MEGSGREVCSVERDEEEGCLHDRDGSCGSQAARQYAAARPMRSGTHPCFVGKVLEAAALKVQAQLLNPGSHLLAQGRHLHAWRLHSPQHHRRAAA